MRLIANLNIGGQYPHLEELTNSFRREYQERQRGTYSSRLSQGSSSKNSNSSTQSRLKNELFKDNQRDRINKAKKLFNQYSQNELYEAESEYRDIKKEEELFEKQIIIEEKKSGAP